MTISEQIRNKIQNGERGTIYFLSDFNYLGNDTQVRNCFVRLERKGILIRLTQGVYLYPYIDENIGILFPSLNSIAEAIAKRDKADILPTGVLALNLLGLSTQVPVNAVYLSSGTPRIIHIGKRKIVFKKAAPKNFSYQGKVLPLIIFALKELGQEGVTDDVKKQLKNILDQNPESTFDEDIVLAPAWVRKIILTIKSK